MKCLKIMVVLSALSILGLARANSSSKRPLVAAYGSGAEFEIESGLVDKIYHQSLDRLDAERAADGTWLQVTPSLSVIRLDQFRTRNEYFTVDYAESLTNMYYVSVAFGQHLARFGDGGFRVFEEVGYSYAQEIVDTESEAGTVLEDNISMQYLPASLAIAAFYEPKFLAGFVPEVFAGAGSSWVQQSGDLDGVEQSFWIPFLKYGMRLNYSSPQSQYQFFAGMTRTSDLDSSHVSEFTQFDLGATFSLSRSSR